jgi:hypothetical protein
VSHRGKEKWLRKASSLKRRVAFDFSFDEKAAAKLTLGLGDSHTPGFSLFTMPMVDIREIPHEVRDGCMYAVSTACHMPVGMTVLYTENSCSW